MKIFTSEEIQILEKCAVDTGMELFSLMEKAGFSVATFLKQNKEIEEKEIVVLCGRGNNGGDGFVAAKRLKTLGAKVSVVLVKGLPKASPAKEAYTKMGDIDSYDWNENKYEIESLVENADIIIDAIFGIGFKGNIDDSIGRLINFVNSSTAYKLAVDIPSGCECDSGKVANYCIKADTTLSFTSAKPVNILKPSAEMCGKTLVAQVGISKDIIDSLPASFSITKEQAVKNMFKKRDPLSHKGMYGKLLMFCGSYGMVGAGIMAARGALRSGVGLLNMVVSKECYPIMATAVPEAVFTIMDDSNEETIKKSSEKLFAAINSATACVIGSGLGEYTEKYLPTVIKFANAPLVLDADALRFLSENLELLKERNAEIVITPHHGEMAKLCKKTTEQIYVDRLLIAKQFSQEHKILTILKGAGTVIASDDGEIKVNTTGNAGMATGGSGDVLAGMIGSLLAQGLSLKDSAVAGVYIHGKAGDICAEKLSQISMLPTDLIEALPEVFSEIETKI